MGERRNQGGLANPVLIGAITVLAVIVAVFLAYNANNGLPFVPSYNLHVQVSDASELTHGAEVHMGGALVGFVDNVEPARLASGQPIAVLDLKLDKSIGKLPVDSTFTIALKGAIGQKYLAIGLGHSTRTFASGATVPLRQTSATVDLDQVLDMFSPPTRAGVVASTVGFSDGLAGRGVDVNNAVGAFVPLLTDLQPVARNLASSHTNLGGFFHGLERPHSPRSRTPRASCSSLSTAPSAPWPACRLPRSSNSSPTRRPPSTPSSATAPRPGRS
jgi:ABC-type transporter Mla subunit MlaD